MPNAELGAVAPQLEPPVSAEAEAPAPSPSRGVNWIAAGRWVVSLLLAFGLGLGSGYAWWGRSAGGSGAGGTAPTASPLDQINPPQGYTLPIAFGDLGPQLMAAGAIDFAGLSSTFKQAGHPLTEAEIETLLEGSDEPVVINRHNAHFLLNFLWAFGLANANPILAEGDMVKYSQGQVERFASTGGWTLAARPITELYGAAPLVALTREQQALVGQVARAVYRPCCNNPTVFPDCNHGMAMLGLLEIMAAQGADADAMFEAAKWVNAFWFPEQTQQLAAFFQEAQGQTFEQADARDSVSANFASQAGAKSVYQYLSVKGLLPAAPGGGGSCGT